MLEKLKKSFSSFIERISKSELKPEKIKPLLEELKLTLIESDVALPVAEEICEILKKELSGVEVPRFGGKRELVKSTLRKILLDLFEFESSIDIIKMIEEKRRSNEPFKFLFVGVNGTGKTTTIAKLAWFLIKRGYTVVLACSDTFRAGAMEQLGEHARKLGIRMLKHTYGADPAAVAYDAVSYAKAHKINVVLIDTAGRMQTDRNLMDELAKIKRVIEPDLTILVVDALTGNDAVFQAEEFHKHVGVDAIIVTKVDADIKGGAALSVTYAIGKPVIFIGTGQNYEDLKRFRAEELVDLILGG